MSDEDRKVIDIQTRMPVAIPASEESDYVAKMEDSVSDVHQSVLGMLEADNEDEFRAHMRDVKDQIRKWPTK